MSSMPARPLPFDDRDEFHLLDDFCNPAISLTDVARRRNLGLDAIAQWTELPHVLPRLEAVRRTARLRADILAAQGASLAVSTLRNLAASLDDPNRPKLDPAAMVRYLESCRKSAAAILRRGTGILPVRP